MVIVINYNQWTSGTGTEAVDRLQAEHQVFGRPPGLNIQSHLKLIENPRGTANVTGSPHTTTDQMTTPWGEAKCPIEGGQTIDPGKGNAQVFRDVLQDFLRQIAIPVLDVLENGQNGRFLIPVLFKHLVYFPQFHLLSPAHLCFLPEFLIFPHNPLLNRFDHILCQVSEPALKAEILLHRSKLG